MTAVESDKWNAFVPDADALYDSFMRLTSFRPISVTEVCGIIESSIVKSGCLDPIPTKLLKNIVSILLIKKLT